MISRNEETKSKGKEWEEISSRMWVSLSLQIKTLICDQLNIHLNSFYFIYLEDKESVPKTPSNNVDEEGEEAG